LSLELRKLEIVKLIII